jgi:hypothetical protein
MKQIVKLLSIAAAVVVTLGACSKDKPHYVGPNDDVTNNIGYLALGSMEASVMEDTEVIGSVTRAEGVDINNFDVVITSQSGEVMASFKYGERPTEPIALDSGVYNITMMSE